MAILSPIHDICETSLTTRAAAEVLPMTDEPRFEVDVHTRLPESASEPTTNPSIEMDSLVNEGVDSFLDDLDVVEERSRRTGSTSHPLTVYSRNYCSPRYKPRRRFAELPA